MLILTRIFTHAPTQNHLYHHNHRQETTLLTHTHIHVQTFIYFILSHTDIHNDTLVLAYPCTHLLMYIHTVEHV